jgi:hypothetical protein
MLCCRVALRQRTNYRVRVTTILFYIIQNKKLIEFVYFRKIWCQKRFMNLQETTRETFSLQSSQVRHVDVIDFGNRSVDMWSNLGSYQMLRRSLVWLKCYWGGQVYGQREAIRIYIYIFFSWLYGSMRNLTFFATDAILPRYCLLSPSSHFQLPI